ncbi:hypothetical protein [Endozoicomonas sp. 8E]|uniref:tetratricopeptide repeat protein n=1 Tax=Endozoicomonas sp. 8E TaxID=3035692 RepID=UPI0029394732|nr:hypothetical protein [Endozoicomonas sp. 8E]WOG26248.1 hypothetical protein P6910_16980 [Endozoicomonas sp. 8E]
MSYGLPPVTKATTSTTPQPPQKADSVTTERRFTLNPEAAPFVPRNQGVDKWNAPSNIRNRQATARETHAPQKFHRWREKPIYPDDTVKRMNDAYDALKTQKFSRSEVAFRSILRIDKDVLNQYDYHKMHIGLARSLNEQNRAKQEEACSLLKELRSKTPVNEFGASIIHNLDLTLSRSEQALGQYLDAETRLLRLRNKKPDADVQALCKSSDNFDADIAIARLWQLMKKHRLTETLLLNLKAELTEKLQPKQSAVAVEKLHQKLRTVNMAMARHWELTGKYKLAEKLLLNMSGKNLNNSEEVLCKPSGHDDIDLTLMRLWEIMGKHRQTEKLLLNMSKKSPDASEETLCSPCGNYLTDLALVRYWDLVGNNPLAEKLLLNMSGKHPDASEEELCKPCWQKEIDLTLVRFWEVVGKYSLSERLLLNMIEKHPGDSEEILCQPSEHQDVDLALARLWQMMDQPERCEKLLLKMCGKSLNDHQENLCQPSGNHDNDLALVHHWQIMGNGLAEKLTKRCYALYHSNECELALLGFSAGKAEFMEIISRQPESANTLIVTSIHYFRLACQQILEDDPKSGKDNLDKALEYVESAITKYPQNAGACSQKAHCLRMMGATERVWQGLFQQAYLLDASRTHKGKAHFWRREEAAALQKLQGLTKKLPDQVPG